MHAWGGFAGMRGHFVYRTLQIAKKLNKRLVSSKIVLYLQHKTNTITIQRHTTMKTFTASQTIYEILEDNGIVLYTSEDMTIKVTPEQEKAITDTLKALDIEDDWFFEE